MLQFLTTAQRIAVLVLTLTFLIGCFLILNRYFQSNLQPELILQTITIKAQGAKENTPVASQNTAAPIGFSKININKATAKQLERLPDIGPVLSQRIIEYRNQHGPFKKIEELRKVPGIGPKTFQKIKPLVDI